MDLTVARDLFAPDPGYLNTATVGVPPRSVLAATTDVLEAWRRGQLAAREFDEHVGRSRAAWARLSGVPVERVAVGSTVSEFVGLIAAALPDGARVVTARGEFTSLLFPFLAHADRGVAVDELPLEDLAGFAGSADLVAVSAVQSSDGRVADLDAISATARAAGAATLVDTTQSCGWLPLDCSGFDFVACTAYKWLLSPRGTAFLYVRDETRLPLRPLAAGWYAGELPWESIYGSPLRLASSARRYDVSPAWFSWVGTAAALELLASLDAEQVRAHDVGLANEFNHRLGLPGSDSAIVVVDQPGAEAALAAAGVRTAVRAGRVRASFHLYNDEHDVELAVAALTG